MSSPHRHICECGGLRSYCAQLGYHSIGSGRHTPPEPKQYTVVWNGRDELLDERAERVDGRLASMPTYDLDDGQVARDVVPRRKYTRTGRYARPQLTAQGGTNGRDSQGDTGTAGLD